MLIQCTKKLLDQLKIKPEGQVDEEPLFSWHANLINVDRRKTVVLMNDQTRYTIVLFGLKAKDFKKLDQIILQGIRDTFLEECIGEEVINQFINKSNEIQYAKTKNRSMVACLNKSCDMVYYFIDLLLDGIIIQSDVSRKINGLLVGNRQNNFFMPNAEMYRALEILSGKNIWSCSAAQLKVTLDMEKHHIWRRIMVPVNWSFFRLHQILQEVFGWQECHLHRFIIYGKESNKERYRAIVNLVCDEEDFEYEKDEPMRLDQEVKLSEYIPAKMKYVYDFGDNWEHYIEVEKIVEDYDKNYAVCLEGEGNSPPEDVGGDYGYDEFLRIIADKDDPEHEIMVEWGSMQGYAELNIEAINQALRRI